MSLGVRFITSNGKRPARDRQETEFLGKQRVCKLIIEIHRQSYRQRRENGTIILLEAGIFAMDRGTE